jgi:hypothetical protein
MRQGTLDVPGLVPQRHGRNSTGTIRTLLVMAGLVPAISIGKARRSTGSGYRHKAGDDVSDKLGILFNQPVDYLIRRVYIQPHG